MSKIEEMAKEYAVMASFIMEEAEAGRSNPLTISNIFINGAQAVLQEIESVFQKVDIISTTSPISAECVLRMVKEKIKELKGE